MKTIIFHIDVNSAFLSWEAVYRIAHKGGRQDLREIYQAACRLFLELWDRRPIRHLGIHTSRVREDDFFRQTALFDEVDYEKLEKMDKTVDALRKRYGIDSVMRAAFLKQPIDHMSGGISREKRTVDYDRIAIE